MNYDYSNQEVLATTLIFQRDADSFFNPAGLAHTGYAADGIWYDSGVPNSSRIAPWFSESSGTTRGSRQSFPQPAIVLLSVASLTILDESVPTLDMWMIFYRSDVTALANNFLGHTSGYMPASVTWANGLLSVNYTPDPGSTDQAALMLTIDFAHDRVFLDTSV